MKKNTYIQLIAALMLAGYSAGTVAQENKTNEKALNREMTLEREYDPTVQDANKVNTLPVVKEPTVTKRPIDYAGFTLPANPESEITRLSSGKIMTQIPANRKRGYLHFGGGSYLNLDGDFGYHLLNTDKDKLNLWFSHRSTNGNVKYLQNDEKVKAKINDNLGGIDFKHTFEKAILDMGIKYGYATYNYFGYTLLSPPLWSSTYYPGTAATNTDKETNQADQLIQTNIGIQSAGHVPFGYLLGIDYTRFSHKYGLNKEQDEGVAEQTVGIDLDLNTPLGDHLLGVDGRVEVFNYTQPNYLSDIYQDIFDNYTQAVLSPYLKLEGDNWHARIGAKALIVAGLKNDAGKTFTLTPNLSADVTVAEQTVLYGKIDGNLRSNSMYEIAQITRYASPLFRIQPSRDWWDSQLGIKSRLAPGFWMNLFGGYRMSKNDYNFISPVLYEKGENFFEIFPLYFRPKLTNPFVSLYGQNGIESKQLYIGADFKYSYQQWVDIQLKGVYNNWKLGFTKDNLEIQPQAHQSERIGRPVMEINAGVTLRPMTNLSASLDYYLATGRKAAVGENVKELKNINELNLTGNYTLNDTFGIYLKMKNVLFQKQELFYGYPLQSFGVMAGFNLLF